MWSSFPAEHKKRFYQGLASYALLCTAVGVWVGMNAPDTIKNWQSRIPSASAEVKSMAPVAVAAGSDQEAVAGGRIYVSIIVADLGLSPKTTEKALSDLPKGVSLAFSPYASGLDAWLKKAASLGRETLIYMPMESATYPQDDPGPRALSSRLSDKDNSDNLKWVLDRGKGTVGVINFMGSRFLKDKKRLAPVFETLQKNGSIFIETGFVQKSEAAGIASQSALPYMAVDLKIDADVSEASMRQQLAKLAKTALERGYAIGIAEPYPITISTISSWSTGLAKQGITLAPLKVVWKNQPHDNKAATPAPEQAPK